MDTDSTDKDKDGGGDGGGEGGGGYGYRWYQPPRRRRCPVIITNPGVKIDQYNNAKYGQVSQLTLFHNRIRRGGVLFYTIMDRKLYICFGRDSKTNELTDFGGQRLDKETIVQCAVREGNEESRCSFGKIGTSIHTYGCLYNSEMLIILIPVPSSLKKDSVLNFEKCINLDEKAYRDDGTLRRSYREMKELVWLSEEEILKNLFSLDPQINIFTKVRRFLLSSCRNFEDFKKYFVSKIDK